jgi:predicted lipid-binding transport protein (Tim44 family)
VLSAASSRSGVRLARRLRAPVSLGLGLPLLLGSTPAAAAGSGGLVLGGLAPWVGVLAALWALLAPRHAVEVTGTVALASFSAVVLAGAAWRFRPQRRRDGDAGPERHVHPAASSFIASSATRAAGFHPPGLDGAEVLEAARARFLRLQAAWDAGDVQALGHLTTPAMLAELLPMLTTRGVGSSRTDVITLHAELLGLEELGAAYLASVEFSGLIRESAEQGAVPFRELWMLACEKDGSPSWRLARQQALF